MKSFLLLLALSTSFLACSQKTKKTPDKDMKYNELNDEEKRVIINKGTERAFTGKYHDYKKNGVYVCKQCSYPLFTSDAKFDSGTGWPSFDDMIGDHVKEIPDADGMRTEIVCDRCEGHLGHVFKGERLTEKSTRHCVNSISLDFVAAEQIDSAIFASGCFWGTEYYMERASGVLFTEVGYIGGSKDNPTYKEVCSGSTGHAEATKVYFDKNKIDYKTLAKLFFETHDPTQVNRQGPDIGTQYRTEIFYLNEEQKKDAQELKAILEQKGVQVATKITEATEFWVAEDYHQQYYSHKGTTPYCHHYIKRF